LHAARPGGRIAEIKAADPQRVAVVEVFEAWHAVHGDALIKKADLAAEVIERIDDTAKRNSDGKVIANKNKVTRFLTAHTGTCLSGYALTAVKDDTRTRTVLYYKLTKKAA
jgi:hypothetical protein